MLSDFDLERLRQVTEEARWLCSRGYPAAAVAAFIAEHRALSPRERDLLDASARADANHKHHIARELEPEDVERRPLRVDPASVLMTVCGLVDASQAPRSLVLESAGGLVFVIEPAPPRSEASMARAITAVAEALVALKPQSIRLVHDASGKALAERLAAALPKRSKLTVTLDGVDSVAEKLTHAVHVVSAEPGVLDRCGTWLNLPARMACELGVRTVKLD
ncbi:MAG: DUF434 domain-containing protein [Deltaproteobacteria bacterium]|nr:DUF434 domain-containing protein [Deltaproteobacteria bacterium]